MHVKSIAWQEESPQEAFQIITESKHAQENQTLMEIVSDDMPDEIVDPMTIKSASESLQMVDWIIRFCQQYRHDELIP